VKLDDDTLSFCGTSARQRESFTDSDGEAVFAVVSPDGGELDMIAWFDRNDDDTLGKNEIGRRVKVTFAMTGARTISLTGRSTAVKGRKTQLSGMVTAAVPECASGQIVRIVRKRAGTTKTVATATSTATGSFARKIRITKTATYRAVLGAAGGCDAARSRAHRIHAL
jgi:hypothetical protein